MKHLLLLLLLLPFHASAQWQLQGKGRYDYLWFDIYDAAYYTDGAKQALELKYFRDFSGSDISHQTAKEWRHLKQYPDNRYRHWLAWFSQHCPDVKAGDRLRLEVSADSSTLLKNGHVVARIKDADFGPAFLAIWLSPRTNAQALRRALLGKEEKCARC